MRKSSCHFCEKSLPENPTGVVVVTVTTTGAEVYVCGGCLKRHRLKPLKFVRLEAGDDG